MDGRASPAVEPLDARLDCRGRIDDYVSCRQCDYLLRGLTVEDRCPECATSVRETLESDRLQRRSSAWLLRVEIGLILVTGGLILSFARPWLLRWIVLGWFGAGTAWWPIAMVASDVVATLVLIAGVWLVTSPAVVEPAPSRWSLRRIARLLAFAEILARAVYWASRVVASGPIAGGLANWVALSVVALVMLTTTTTGATIVCIYLGRIAALAQRRRLRRWFLGAAWAVVVAGAATLVLGVASIPMALGNLTSTRLFGVIHMVGLGFFWAGVATGLLVSVLLVTLSVSVHRARRRAT